MSRRLTFRLLSLAAVVGFAASVGAADATPPKEAPKATPAAAPPAAPAKPEAAPAKPDAAAAKPETPPIHVVKKGLMKTTLELDGAFEAQAAAEIVVRLDEWMAPSGLVVANAAKHGATVRKGDVLITFDTDKLDKAIADLTAELKLAELSLRQAEEQLNALQKTTPMDLEANERTARIINEDRRYYAEFERPYTFKTTEFNLKSYKNSLEYVEEELRQLEKMYKADDVTEETEQIVLKRTRDQVEQMKMMVEGAQMRHDFAIKYGLPRQEERMKDTVQRQLLDCDRTRVAVPAALKKAHLELEKLTTQRLRSEERLKGLKADRERMTVKAPLDGILYYGKAVRGKFGDAGALAEQLRPFGTVQTNQVFMTIVQPQSLAIRSSVSEDALQRVNAGMSGVAVPNAFPTLKLAAVMTRCGDVPMGPGSFDAQFKVTLTPEAKAVMPGMGCKVKLVPYLKKDALTIPPKALQTEELDDTTYVWVQGKDGKAAKRTVTVGQKTDKQAEIVQGLAEGDQVLVEAPKDAK